jgi:hypothetical protein
MPWADAERSMRPFAREVMPRLKELGEPTGAVAS